MLDQVMGVLLWGSHAAGGTHVASDVDVCVVAGPGRDPAAALRAAWTQGRLVEPRHDVKVFEELPLYLKGEVLESGLLIGARHPAALAEYLRTFRKVWEDQSVRRHGEDELSRLIEARRLRGRA